MAYTRKQSTRAEITRWYFENEYHFGDFHGDADGLLRHGYEVHLHYANFGVRKVSIRLPAGLPFPKSVWSKYIGVGELSWTKDSKAKGGILTLNPFHEAGELEEIWSPGEYLDDVVELRGRLLAGDLRILYLLWLCAAFDAQSVSLDVIEPPVPGGLAECMDSCGAVMEFFGLDPLMLVSASEGARRQAAERERERQERMKQMVKDPQKWLREADKLIAVRGTENYEAAAEILVDLGEAVGGDEGSQITCKHAAHLAKKHPTLNRLKSSLRKRGLLE